MFESTPPTGLAMFEQAVSRARHRPAIHYFDQTITFARLDELSSSFALQLRAGGFGKGDRLIIHAQNIPPFVIAMLAAWKLGGVCVPANPMYRERELELILADCEPAAMICQQDLVMQGVGKIRRDRLPPQLFVVSADDFQSRFDSRVFRDSEAVEGTRVLRLSRLADPRYAVTETLGGNEPAMLVYTSGTTGAPKGAIIPHAAFAFNSGSFPRAARLAEGEAILGVAPLFHITGLVACWGSSMLTASPLILAGRFDAGLTIEAIAEWKPKFMVAALTVYIAIYNHEAAAPNILDGIEKIYSGGSPVPEGFVRQFEEKFGRYIHNCYGLTETAAPTHIVPFGTRAPVSNSGKVVSIGPPVAGANAMIIDESGALARPGNAGELIIQGPMVSPGYYQKPEETAESMCADGFRTGDIAFRDHDGWYYIIDRKKDMIISSGFKVFPREVEDVLYSHPSVREAAVVGVPDSYRGETVKAVVSAKPGKQIDCAELLEFCRARMAAYKYPRLIEVVDELPKTASGKILRRALRKDP